jgi:hypothetical protein
MTHEELEARYRLLAKSQSDGVESWEAVDAETEQEVNVHRLATSRQISILDMMAHLDPAERARIVEHLVVDDVPVIVTKRLPRSTTFIEWLQNSVPSTVTSVIRPLTRPREPQAPSAKAPQPAPSGESLTAIFLASQIPAPASTAPEAAAPPEIERIEAPPLSAMPSPSAAPSLSAAANKPAVDPPVEKEERRATPPTPIANLAGGLTDIFSASELLEKIGPEATVKRGAITPPRSESTPLAAPVPARPTPPGAPPPHRAPPTPPSPLDAFRLDGGLPNEVPEFRPEPIAPARATPASHDELLDSEPPDFRKTFVAPAEPRKPPARPPRLDQQPPPQLGSRQSPYTEVIEGRRTPGMPANPAVIAPPPPARQPSILPVVIVIGVLVLAIVATAFVILLNRR